MGDGLEEVTRGGFIGLDFEVYARVLLGEDGGEVEFRDAEDVRHGGGRQRNASRRLRDASHVDSHGLMGVCGKL